MTLPALGAFALLLGALPGARASQAPDDKTLEPLAEALASYDQARAEALDMEQARSRVESELGRIATQQGKLHPLARPSTLGRGLLLAREVKNAKRKLGKPGKVVEERYEDGSFRIQGLDYVYRLPKAYSPELTWPMILSLPGEDERPAAHLRSHWVQRELLDQVILVSPAMPKETEAWDKVMVSGYPGGLAHALTTLRLANEHFSVDPDRIFVAGRGASVATALALGDHAPQRFAGVIGRAGDAGQLGPANLANLPVYFASGGAEASAYKKAAEEQGQEHCKLVPNAGEGEVLEWLLAQRRNTYPDKVRLVVGTPFPSRVHWLKIASIDPKANARGTIDRASNTIQLELNGVSFVTLYLNDSLLDLDQPVTVQCNAIRHQVQVRRNLATTLDLASDGTSDPGCVYVAELTLDARPDAIAQTLGTIDPLDEQFNRYLADAGSNVEALMDLYRWALENGRAHRAGIPLRRILRVDEDHAEARAGLGHVQHAGIWFPTSSSLALFQASQIPADAEARGLVEEDGIWMHPDDRRLVNRGWSRDYGTGLWTSPDDRKRLEAGEARQDYAWIPADQVGHIDDELWFVEGEWLPLERANRRRSRIDSAWEIPSPHVRLLTTADRATGEWALHEMARSIPDLIRVFGLQPQLPLDVGMLRIEEQYDVFAFGDPDGRRPPNHGQRLHIIHHAFYAESRFPRVDGKLTFGGMGVGYWDAAFPGGDSYGVHSARLAFGLSWVEALDPSTKVVRKALKSGPDQDYAIDYEAKKQLPAWLRWGGAVYAERYFHDETVDPDDPQANPWWARSWSLDNLERRGGLGPLDTTFAFDLNPDDRDGGHKLLLEAGLLVAFLIDGECEPVQAAHAEWKRALVAGRMHPKRIEALEEALRENEEALRAFSGM